jgi:hypothetical protein
MEVHDIRLRLARQAQQATIRGRVPRICSQLAQRAGGRIGIAAPDRDDVMARRPQKIRLRIRDAVLSAWLSIAGVNLENSHADGLLAEQVAAMNIAEAFLFGHSAT